MKRMLALLVMGWLMGWGDAYGADDIPIADSREAWRKWKAVGAAFVKHEAADSRQGRHATGTLTSPEFTLDRKYLTFVIGGGQSRKLRFELLVDGKVVRSAGSTTGANNLDPAGWNVGQFEGKSARLRLVDEEVNGIEHICVDRVVLSDHPPPAILENVKRELTLDKPLLLLPVALEKGASTRKMEIRIDGQPVRIFGTTLAHDGKGDTWMPLDVSAWQGKKAQIVVDRMVEGGRGLDAIHVADSTPGDERIYSEPSRPQFHFTPSRGWMGDPNGLVYYKGTWHFFWQHDPYGVDHTNMCWGHAVSKDLLHWEERRVAIYNDYLPGGLGSIYSGGGFVDVRNTAGFKAGDEDAIVLAFLATAKGPSLSFSTDGGRTFTLYKGNPVIPDGGWDPKVIWFEPKQQWVMATSKSQEPGKPGVTFYTSKDLKNWKYQSWMEGMNECPEIFELPVDGDPARTKWMVYGNGGPYSIGTFDGSRFTLEHGPYAKQSGQACQTWSGAPEGRRIELGLLGRVYGLPTMGIQTLPVEITLRTLPDGSIRAFKNPVRELESLRSATLVSRTEETLNPGAITLATVKDDMMDILAEFEVDEAAVKAGVKIFFTYRGRLGGYDATKPKIHDRELKPVDGRIRMRIVVDRAVHEAFYNDGLIYQTAMHDCRDPKPDRTLRLEVAGAPVKLKRLEVHELGKAGWKPFSSRQLIETVYNGKK